MPPTKPPYPPEFRREAVQLARSGECSIAQVARDLGVSDQTLRNWIKQADVDAGRRGGLSSEEREGGRRQSPGLPRLGAPGTLPAPGGAQARAHDDPGAGGEGG
jgi:transposase-like protein